VHYGVAKPCPDPRRCPEISRTQKEWKIGVSQDAKDSGPPGMDVSEKFNNIVHHLVDGRIVPFVGAGISARARGPLDSGFEPKIESLQRLLKQRICCHLRSSGTAREERELARGSLKRSDGSEASFGQLAEVGKRLVGLERVYDWIGIGSFEHLLPTRAHYAIACLALEGLVEEVISTNWDCCIEKALEELTCTECDSELSRIRVICDLHSYRQHGASRKTERGEPVLKLYKINGCARKYCKSKGESSPGNCKNNAADEVIITERQLQNFGKKSWAQDLFKDRARCRTLLFSGFGSDEPQVRHTVLQLLEEFQVDDSKKEPPDGAKKGSVNAVAHDLFMTVYEERLSFNQAQIMFGFCEGAGFGSALGEEVTKRVITGKDTTYFGESDSKNLSADAFWCAFFEAAIARLITDRYSCRNSSLDTWLNTNARNPDAIRDDWLHWLFPPEKAKSSAFHCAVPGLFGPNPSRSNDFLLGGWLRAMGWRPPHDPSSGTTAQIVYRPLQDEALLPLATLVTIFLLLGRTPDGKSLQDIAKDHIKPADGGLCVLLNPTAPRQTLNDDTVFLVVQDQPERRDMSEPATEGRDSRIRYEIAIPARLSARPDSRVHVTTEKGLMMRHRRRIDAAAFVRLASSGRERISMLSLFAHAAAPARPRDRLRRLETENA
jgi:hypothetical protein